ncbi:type 1 glutamine amidotransferase domain-containing protein [Novosphingobium sp.]|uniref:type 1 glutamine amidotransferase domain-containing protein n=1 Tax=Novosphingobium sp. TaxID=1874826 RepID=UPI0025E0ABFC|nr:type 1 glutamine amidotransferase domain-containing protein [Novosphingobium sp.]MCC6924785.1 DJ-1/PfpI family protein [Novosphingobium sp.]
MAKILIILPEFDYDPSEVALPWLVWSQAGHEVCFATDSGQPAYADPITLTGEGLPLIAASLKARMEAEAAYATMIAAPHFKKPVKWAKARAGDYAALHFPGGHAPGMKSYCESPEVFRLGKEAFAANQPVSAICHGVLPLARAGLLKGKRTTALTHIMEEIAVRLTAKALPGHYRTYPISVETEVCQRIGKTGKFERGGLFPRYAGSKAPNAGFVVQDGNYLSARWPGDAWTLAVRLGELL